MGVSFIESMSGVTLPGLPNGAPQNLGTTFTVAGLLALLFRSSVVPGAPVLDPRDRR